MQVKLTRHAKPYGVLKAWPVPKRGPSIADLARVAGNYLRVFSGTSGRLVLQAAYFLVLTNTLGLAEMGSFAAASAIGIMIGAFSGFGFSAIAFQAAASRQRLLGRYFGIFLVGSAITLPIGLLLSAPFYFAIFKGALALHTFMMIMIVEIFMFRLIEGLHKINNGLGRFTVASLVFILQSGSRAAAAVLFAAWGGGNLDGWVDMYFIANGLATLAAFALFGAQVRIRWDTKLFIARFRDAVLFAFSSLTFDAQTEVDKVVFLVIAGDRAAGIYAISIRIIELAIIPVRTFFVLYSRKLIRERRHDNIVSRNLLIEGSIFAATVGAYGVFLALLSLKPNVLGANVEVARQLFGMALLVPAFRSMMELHSELYFAYRKLGTQAVVTLLLVALKAAMIAAMVSTSADPAGWGYSLNWIFAALYLLSAVVVYRAIGATPPRPSGSFA